MVSSKYCVYVFQLYSKKPFKLVWYKNVNWFTLIYDNNDNNGRDFLAGLISSPLLIKILFKAVQAYFKKDMWQTFCVYFFQISYRGQWKTNF